MIELFKIGFLDVTLFDLLDIAVVTALFYGIYTYVRNTIAAQVFVGIVLLLGIYFLSEILQLRSINWLLRFLVEIWLIAFIILFQPELRRLMLMLMRSNIFKAFTSDQLMDMLEGVKAAVDEMSERRVGALIVFVRSRDINMTVDTGVPIEGTVSAELLLSIFNTRSPLHDGAVIVQNNMIKAAGCILPLSTTTKYDNKILGTRHRAGLGISEQADVVALIVSEETGGITIAEAGIFEFNIAIENLPTELEKRLTNKAPNSKEPSLRESLMNTTT